MAQFQRGWWRPAAVISSAAFVAVLSTAPINALAEEAGVSDEASKSANEQVIPAEEQETGLKASSESQDAAGTEEKVTASTKADASAADSTAASNDTKVDEPKTDASTTENAKADSSKSDTSTKDGSKVDSAADGDSTKADDKADNDKDDSEKDDSEKDDSEEPDSKADGATTDDASKADDAKAEETEAKASSDKANTASNKTVEDGVYAIGSGNKVDSVLDAQNGGRSNGTNAQLYESNMTGSQKWEVKYHEKDGGYYTIGLYGTNLVLDVQYGVAKNGTNVWLYESNGSKAQRWSIVKNSKGLWSILSQLGNFYLDAWAGGTSNGTNLQIYQGNGTGAQSFYFLQYNPAAPAGDAHPVEDGVYVIGSDKANGNKVLDINGASMDNGGNAQLYDKNGTSAQRFYFEYDGNGYYTITNLGSGKVLDLNAAGIMPGTNVQQYASNNTAAQKWAIRKDQGFFYLVNKATGLALDAQWAGTSNGTNVWGYLFDKSSAQRWRLTKDGDFIKTGSDGTGIYQIIAFNNTGRVFDIKNGSSSDGGQLQLWDSNDSLAQRFEIHAIGNNEYRIRTAASGGWLTIQNGKIIQSGNSNTDASSSNTWKAVWKGGYFSLVNAAEFAFDLTGGSVSSGTVVQGYKANGTAAQHFFFRAADLIKNGCYTIASGLGKDKTLDVKNGSFANGSNVQIWSKNDSNAQKFKITKSGNAYVITAGSSDFALDAKDGGKGNGTNIQLYEKNGTAAQSWTVRIIDGGKIVFVNVGSGRVLDVNGANASDGANVQLYDANGTAAQSWKLTETTISNGWVFVNGRWTFGGTAYSTSCYNAWQRIKDKSGLARASSYGVQPYIITIDNTACRVAIFQGKQGDWKPIFDWAAGVGDPHTYDHGTFLTDDPNIGGKGFDMFIGNNWDGTEVHKASVPSDGLVAFTSFFGAQGFHSTCGNHSDPSQTGKQISHGCVRLLEANAWWIYNNIPLGTLVYSF